jgi:hypothetical protein
LHGGNSGSDHVIEHGGDEITLTIGNNSNIRRPSNRSNMGVDIVEAPALVDGIGSPLAGESPGNIDIAIPEYGRDELEEEDDEYGSEDDSEDGARISKEILDEIYQMLNSINEDRLEENFKNRLFEVFADVASLKARFPVEKSSHERLQEQFQEINDELDGLRHVIERFRDGIEHKVREMNNEIAEEKEN